MNCDKVAAKTEEYVSGVLTQEEMSAFDAHLKDCPECRAWLDSYRQVAHSFKASLPFELPEDDFVLPEGHADRFRAKLAARTAKPPRRNLLRPALFTFGGAIAAVLVIGLGIWVAALASELESQRQLNGSLNGSVVAQSREIESLRDANARTQAEKDALANGQAQAQAQLTAAANERDRLAGQLQSVSSERDKLEGQLQTISSERDDLQKQLVSAYISQERVETAQRISALMGKPQAQMRTVTSQQAGLTVLMSPSDRTIVLVAHSFPKLAPGQEYRVWLQHTTGALIPGGILTFVPLPGASNLGETVVEVPETMANYTGLFVTIENSGSNAPKGQEVVRMD
jgi:anti-sigma factor RsiW